MLDALYYELSTTAARQLGLVTRAQAIRLGVDAAALDRLKQAKLLQEIDTDVFELPSSPTPISHSYPYAAWLALRQQDLAQRQGAEVAPATAAPEIECADEAPAGKQEDLAKDPCSLPGVEYFAAGTGFSIGDIAITPFTIPHDAADPVGFVFEADGVRMAIATDLGYMPPNVKMAIRNCDVLMIESNHDLEMLRDGPYPWSVKQRVMSRVGHLSNEAVSDFLEKNYDGNASYVVLAHLSECNNLPELALVTAERALRDRMSLLANKLILAQQDAPLEAICL